MRSVLGLLVFVAVLSGCNRAKVDEPDNHNPAHCIAAATYQVVLWEKAGKDPEQVRDWISRAIFEGHKWTKSGRSSSERKTVLLGMLKAYGNKPKVMNALSAACLAAENADPDFSAQRPGILAFMKAHPTPSI
jgi:hypothetical protein